MRVRLVSAAAAVMLGAAVQAANAGVILSEDVTVGDKDHGADKPHEYLIDSMDVGSLSPHARLLLLPRPMITRELALSMRSGRVSPPTEEWKRIIAKAAAAYGLPEDLIASVIRTESAFQADAVSPAGAQGAMQIMPQTQAYLGLEDPWDPEANVMAGSSFLKEQLDRFGSVELALAAYNAGPGNVLRYGGVPPFEETRSYIRSVLSRLDTAKDTEK